MIYVHAASSWEKMKNVKCKKRINKYNIRSFHDDSVTE